MCRCRFGAAEKRPLLYKHACAGYNVHITHTAYYILYCSGRLTRRNLHSY